MDFAIVAITAGGARLARRIAAEAGAGEVYLPERLRQADGCRYFAQPLAALLPELFGRFRGLVCIMATGIVVRLLAPQLRGKALDPAVVVLDEAGQFVISLLSGHLGGGNELARELAELLGGQAVITTATDVNGLPAWDEVARREGLTVEPLANVVTLNSLLLQQAPIALVDRRERVARHYAELPFVLRLPNFATALQASAAGRVFVTHRHIPQAEASRDLLLLRPRDLVLGIGCNRGTSVEEIEAAVRLELQQAFLAFASLACVATIDDKADEEGITRFARRHQLPLEFHSAAALNAVAAPSPPSPHALAAVGAKGVCEPAALLSAGGGALLVRKKKVGNLTLAVAEKA
jgi:cobalt-precorrin 5A hydrolase